MDLPEADGGDTLRPLGPQRRGIPRPDVHLRRQGLARRRPERHLGLQHGVAALALDHAQKRGKRLLGAKFDAGGQERPQCLDRGQQNGHFRWIIRNHQGAQRHACFRPRQRALGQGLRGRGERVADQDAERNRHDVPLGHHRQEEPVADSRKPGVSTLQVDLERQQQRVARHWQCDAGAVPNDELGK